MKSKGTLERILCALLVLFLLAVPMACISGSTETGADDDTLRGAPPNLKVPVQPASSGVVEIKLTAADGVAGDQFGSSVSVSGDTIVVGAPGKDAHTGAAYVVSIPSSPSGRLAPWRQDKLSSGSAPNKEIGSSVSVSGNTIVVGTSGSDGTTWSRAFFFVRSGTTWTLQTGHHDYAPCEGHSVSVSGDTIVVGIPRSNPYWTSDASVYTRSGTAWTYQGSLYPVDVVTNVDKFGSSVSVSGDTAVVGAYGSFSGLGAAWVFKRSGTTWTQQAVLKPTDGRTFNDKFGYSVSVSGDTAVVGAYGKNRYTGAAYVFKRSGTTWTQQAKLTASDGYFNDWFGNAVSVSGDTIVVGSSQRNRAFVYVRSGNAWPMKYCLGPSDGVYDRFAGHIDKFGYSVSASASGNMVVVGAPHNDSDKGAVYLYRW